MKKFLIAGIIGFSFSIASLSVFATEYYIWKVNYVTDGYGYNPKFFADCVGGSGSDSQVGSWRCKNIARYRWKIIPSSVQGWSYIVNAENGKCLSRYSRKNKIRYYGFSESPCKQSDFRLWRFLDQQGNIVPRWNIIPGGQYKIELKKSNAGCLSTRLNDFYYSTTYRQAKLSTQICNQDQGWSYPVLERVFTIGGNPLDPYPGYANQRDEMDPYPEYDNQRDEMDPYL